MSGDTSIGEMRDLQWREMSSEDMSIREKRDLQWRER